MRGCRTMVAAALGVLTAGEVLGRAVDDDRGRERAAFELRIALDVELDELVVELINRSGNERAIARDSLDRVNLELDPIRDESSYGLPSSGHGFGRGRWSSWGWVTVRLRPRQMIGVRFSFCKHDFLAKPRPSILEKIEHLLEKTKAVRYKVTLRLRTPDAKGKPITGPRLVSNTILIDRNTLDALKAARARIDAQVE